MNEVQVIVSPKQAYELEQKFRIVKKSIDARQRELKVHLTLLTDDQGNYIPLDSPFANHQANTSHHTDNKQSKQDINNSIS